MASFQIIQETLQDRDWWVTDMEAHMPVELGRGGGGHGGEAGSLEEGRNVISLFHSPGKLMAIPRDN